MLEVLGLNPGSFLFVLYERVIGQGRKWKPCRPYYNEKQEKGHAIKPKSFDLQFKAFYAHYSIHK